MSVLIAAILCFAPPQIDPNIVVWRTYKAGVHSNAEDQQIRVLDTLADFQQYVRAFDPRGIGDGRDVDWGKEELVAIHIGARNTGGYSVEVSKIAKVTPNEARVSWAELTPIPGVAKSQDKTSPWTIVRLNRPGVRITFSGRKEEGRLPGGIKIINFPGFDDCCKCCATCIREHQDSLPFRMLASGDDSPVVAASTCVINSSDDWVNYVRNFRMGGLGDPPDIDWYRERLVAIHLGRKLTPGYQVLLDRIRMVDSTRVDVSYLQIEPSNRTLTANSSTGPYWVVRVPRVGGLVTFTKRIVTDAVPIQVSSCDCGCPNCRYCGR